MTTQKHILVLESENLLTNSVVSLLSAQTAYAVSIVKFNGSFHEDRSCGREPDVFILDQAELVTNITAVMELVDRHPQIRLIVLGLNDNLLHIFNQQIVEVEKISDFLEQL